MYKFLIHFCQGLSTIMKRCSRCEEKKDRELFSRNRKSSDGRQNECKACMKIRRTGYREDGYSIAYMKEYYENNKEKFLKTSRESRLKREFGITQEQYEEMFEEQEGLCAICSLPEKSKSRKYLSIDHCHDTGKVRGLLCGKCNRGIGYLCDDVNVLEAAAKYIRKFK